MKRIWLIILSCFTIIFILLVVLWHVPVPVASPASSLVVNNEALLPVPSITPQQVVDIQLKAMQQNDHPYEDHGIEVAYRFASPSNKESTGPLADFAALVRHESYHSLLNFQRYGLDDIMIEGDKAIQKVTLIDADDQPVVYYFKLSIQQESPFTNCWMTDGVVRY